jgi:hypothetical protein
LAGGVREHGRVDWVPNCTHRHCAL